MKNLISIYKNYMLLVFLAIASTACTDFLQEKPKSILTEDNYYRSTTDAINAVNAAYFVFNGGGTQGSGQSIYQSMLNVGMDFATDDLNPGPGATNPDVRSLAVHNHSSTNRTFYENWQQHYAGIRKANVAIEKIPGIDFGTNTALQKRLIGEAKFIRAWLYFNLVRLWGDVPLVTGTSDKTGVTDYYTSRTPSTEVYTQIENDLKDAALVLPETYPSTEAGRATKGAAIALLAKVYLTKASFPLQITSHYQDAVNAAELALSPKHGGTGTFKYDLRADYSHVYLPAYKNNEEHIFSAQRLTNFQGQGNNDFFRSLPATGVVPGVIGIYADQVVFYSKEVDPTNADPKKRVDKQFSIFKLYQLSDKRRKGSFATRFRGNTPTTSSNWYGLPLANESFPRGGLLADSVPFLNKYYDPNALSLSSESAANVPLFKYSELLLIHAEAANEAGDQLKAEKSLNFIRARAGLPNITSGLSKDQLRDSIYLDRRLELVHEYQRWFDLIRQKDASNQPIFVRNLKEVGKVNAVDRNRLFPIPQIEIDNNPKITQNPGW